MATTSAVAEPETTFVPMKTRLRCSSGVASAPPPSAGARRWANFSTGSDSPVSADCAMNRSRAASTRQSAGIMSPADSSTRSPGTSWRIGISCGVCRSTVAVLLTIALSSSAARIERCSWTKRIAVLSTTIAPMTIVVFRSAVAYETSASVVSSRLNGFL